MGVAHAAVGSMSSIFSNPTHEGPRFPQYISASLRRFGPTNGAGEGTFRRRSGRSVNEPRRHLFRTGQASLKKATIEVLYISALLPIFPIFRPPRAPQFPPPSLWN